MKNLKKDTEEIRLDWEELDSGLDHMTRFTLVPLDKGKI